MGIETVKKDVVDAVTDVETEAANLGKKVTEDVDAGASWAERNPYWTLAIALVLFWGAMLGGIDMLFGHLLRSCPK